MERVRAIDFLGALSLMADMSLGLSAGHGVRTTYLAMNIGRVMRLPDDVRADLFYAALLTDAGCTAWATQAAAAILGNDMEARRNLFFFTDPTDPRDLLKWMAQYMASGERIGARVRRVLDFTVRGRAFMVEGLQNTAQVAARFAGRLDRSVRVQEALRFAFERWDGSGPAGRKRDAIPLISRVTYASIFLEVFHGIDGRTAAVDLVRARRGKDLDPAVADAFLHLAREDEFWQGLESEGIWNTVRELEPDSPFRYFNVDRLDEAAAAFGDFSDLKSAYTAGHSRRVSALAESLAGAMGFSDENLVTVRRAAMLHDIGIVAIPSFVLHKPDARVSDAEREMLRLHPYHAERIIARAPAFAQTSGIVAAHHERPDGRGYFRGLADGQVPLEAQILAVADGFDDLTHAGPERAPLSPDDAFERMKQDAGTAFSVDALDALRVAVGSAVPDAHRGEAAAKARVRNESAAAWPAGLTDREVEVLRILATGASRQDMASRLALSEHTVRHHLEHIYAKIGVRTRVEATLFAIEHGLLS
jgi:HD-GYP domain-containing protein (c-di-GMP phosphodiesterase class II)